MGQKRVLNNYLKMKIFFSMAWKISPLYLILLVGNAIITSGQLLIQVILPKFLIDELLGDRKTSTLIFLAGTIIISNLVFSFLVKTLKRYFDYRNIYMQDKMSESLSEKIMKVDFSYLENPYYLDLKERAVFAIRNQDVLFNTITIVGDTLKSVTNIIGLIAILITLSPVLLIILCITIGVTVLLNASFKSYESKFFDSIIPINRKYGYYVGLSFEAAYQKDVRLYGMSPMLTNRITQFNREINTWFSGYYRKSGLYKGIANVINDLQAALAYGYVGLRVMTNWMGKQIGIGSFSMYISAVVQFTTAVQTFFVGMTGLKQMLKYLDPFMEFMCLPDLAEQGSQKILNGDIDEIKFEQVTFHYPGSEKNILDNISFQVKRGEKISIVGLNGAGKSTLVKLICRLYHPTSGVIKVNGQDIFTYDYESYMDKVAAVFQDYKLFAFTIKENIAGSDKSEGANILEIVKEVGLDEKIDELPMGLNSLIGKEYDEAGIEMSGGQNQKVAIARALYKNSSLIILDEPTSALDPIAEADIYSNFNQLVKGKTAIYISHRMSSSMFCDRILIINEGKVEDYDTHENLMKKKDSLYYKLFQAQAKNYKLEVDY